MANSRYDNLVFDKDDPTLNEDNDDVYQDPNETNLFVLGSASTPGPSGGEDIPMQTMQHEKGGLPDTSYIKESHLLSAQEKSNNRGL